MKLSIQYSVISYQKTSRFAGRVPLTRPTDDLSHKGRGILTDSPSFFRFQVKKEALDEKSPLPLWERSTDRTAIGRVRGTYLNLFLTSELFPIMIQGNAREGINT